VCYLSDLEKLLMDEGGYDIIVPAIPEICTFGKTREEARKMAEDAIRCCLESAMNREEQDNEEIMK